MLLTKQGTFLTRSCIGVIVSCFILLSTITVHASNVGEDGRCPLMITLDFTFGGEEIADYRPSNIATPRPSLAFSYMASIILAMEDFNNRNPSVVAELSNSIYSKNCSVYFPFPTSENQNVSSVVVDSENFLSNTALSYLLDEYKDSSPPCAIVGAVHNDVALKLSLLSTLMDLPMISPTVTSPRFNNKLHPLTTKTMINSHGITEALVDFLQYKSNEWNHTSILYTTDEYSQGWSENLENALEERKPKAMKFRRNKISPQAEENEEFSVSFALKNIKKSTYRTIIVKLFEGWDDLEFPQHELLEKIADVAEKEEINGDDYLWVFWEGMDIEVLLYHSNPNVRKLAKGAGIIKVIDEFQYKSAVNKSDAFKDSWKNRNTSHVNLINEAMPIKNNGTPGYFKAEPDFFQNFRPRSGSGFAYDAVISLGMGACNDQYKRREMKVRQRSLKAPKAPKGCPPPTIPLMDEILATDFHGATGQVVFDEGGKGCRFKTNRRRNSATYGMYNIRENSDDELKVLLSEVKMPSKPATGDRDKWLDSNWISLNGGFEFSDGSKNELALFRDPPEMNFLSKAVQIFGLFLMSFSLFLCMASSLWIYRNQNLRSVKAAQPMFLHCLCLGAFISSLSIFTLSFDDNDKEGRKWTEDELDVLCMCFPWLVCIGFLVIYCALFSKLWRINKVLQFSRRKVEVKHVIGPFVTIVLSAIVVLTVWTAAYPMKWGRSVTDIETEEEYGKCDNEEGNSHIFIFILTALVVLSFAMTGGMAWKTKDIDEVYAGTRWIFYTIFVQLQVLFVAIPIMIVLQYASKDASYIVTVMIIVILPVSTIVLNIGPKVVDSFKKPDDKKTRGARTSTRVSGLDNKTPPLSSINNSSSINQSSSINNYQG